MGFKKFRNRIGSWARGWLKRFPWLAARKSRGRTGRRARGWVQRFPWLPALVLLAVLLLAAILGAFLWKAPEWQTPASVVGPKERADLQNEFRKTAAQIALGALVLLGLFLTWLRVRAAEKTVAVAGEQQITERFTRAIDQLGSLNRAICLGGIYALERIAKDSPDKDHWQIMEVLTAYVRENARWIAPPPGQDGPANEGREEEHRLPTHIQAILTVLGRRDRTFEKAEQRLDLSRTDLRRALLTNANLAGADLIGANLERAILHGANLERAILYGANLAGAGLYGANLAGADLDGADLAEVNLTGANLERAALIDANLARANLIGADLTGASLTRADLPGAYLRDADLAGADLMGANLMGANLAGASLDDANLAGALLIGADLAGANLFDADLAGAYLWDAKGLTPEQVASARSTEGAMLPEHLAV